MHTCIIYAKGGIIIIIMCNLYARAATAGETKGINIYNALYYCFVCCMRTQYNNKADRAEQKLHNYFTVCVCWWDIGRWVKAQRCKLQRTALSDRYRFCLRKFCNCRCPVLIIAKSPMLIFHIPPFKKRPRKSNLIFISN